MVFKSLSKNYIRDIYDSRYSGHSVNWPRYREIRVTGTRVSGRIPNVSVLENSISVSLFVLISFDLLSIYYLYIYISIYNISILYLYIYIFKTKQKIIFKKYHRFQKMSWFRVTGTRVSGRIPYRGPRFIKL